ncbi:MAG: hypothetical protein ABSC48_07005 [Terracidiphilus sp.]|jgi:hypothetical protein
MKNFHPVSCRYDFFAGAALFLRGYSGLAQVKVSVAADETKT